MDASCIFTWLGRHHQRGVSFHVMHVLSSARKHAHVALVNTLSLKDVRTMDLAASA